MKNEMRALKEEKKMKIKWHGQGRKGKYTYENWNKWVATLR